MRQIVIVGDGPGLIGQAQALMGLGWAVTVTAWASAPALQPDHILIANLPRDRAPDAFVAPVREWTRACAVIAVVDRHDPEAANDLYRAGVVAVVETSAGAAMVAQLAERLLDHVLSAAREMSAPREAPSTPAVEGLPEDESLTMGLSVLLQALQQDVGRIVPYERLFHALGYERQDAMRNRRALAAQMVRLRKALRGAPYRIRGRNNGGYALVPIRGAAPKALNTIPLSDARGRRQTALARHGA